MAWKDWSYWFRGGLSLGFIGILLFFIWQVSYINHKYIISDLISSLSFPIGYLVYYFSDFSLLIIIPLYFIYYFIIGALIGWIYGKIKNRNVENNK